MYSKEEQEIILSLWAEYIKKTESGIDDRIAVKVSRDTINDKYLANAIKPYNVNSLMSNLVKRKLLFRDVVGNISLTNKFQSEVSLLKEQELISKNKKTVELINALIPDVNISLIKL